MGLFGGKKVKSAQDRSVVLSAALALLKQSTVPQPSIRETISQALKDEGFSDSAVGGSCETAVSSELRMYGETGAKTLDELETWGKTAGIDAVRKAFENTIACLK